MKHKLKGKVATRYLDTLYFQAMNQTSNEEYYTRTPAAIKSIGKTDPAHRNHCRASGKPTTASSCESSRFNEPRALQKTGYKYKYVYERGEKSGPPRIRSRQVYQEKLINWTIIAAVFESRAPPRYSISSRRYRSQVTSCSI